jgi:hypothetical protein
MKFGHYTDKGLPDSEFGYRCPGWDPMPSGKKNVLILGCSHTYGVGHEDDTHWVAHLSKHNTDRLRYWNLGQPGASADLIVRILYGAEKILHPSIIIVCWPAWSRRQRLDPSPKHLTGDDQLLRTETEDTDKHNFLMNVFHVEKFAEKNNCKTFHCFAEESYQQYIEDLDVLKDYTLKNCWPYWDKFEQRTVDQTPSLASDGQHYGAEHHERFAQLFVDYFGKKLK